MTTFSNSIVTKGQRGFVLLPVVMAIALVAGIAFLMNREGAMNVALADRDIQADQARYVAEAGFNHQTWQVQNANCTGYTDITDFSFGSHTYSTTVTPTDASPVSITATGTLDSGTTRAVSRSTVPVYETATTDLVLQPDAADGKDTYLYKWQPSRNFGTSTTLWVRNNWADSLAYSFLSFDVSNIPSQARVTSAVLELRQNSPSSQGGTVGVRRILSDWIEGTANGANGVANWNDRETGVPWTSPGGDFDSTAAATSSLPSGIVGWYQWDITTLVSDWVRGTQVNRGLTLFPESADTYVEFDSSDQSDPTRRPKLTITYACECGVDCSTTTSACDANYAADTLINELDTSGYGSSSIKGLSFFPEGKTFKGVTAPAGGTWISVDSISDEIYLTDMAGTLLASDPTPGTSPTGITFISSGAYADHLAISDFFDEEVAIIDLDGAGVDSISTAALGAGSPVDVTFIGETEGGTYDGMLAALDVDAVMYIVDQAGGLQATVDVSAVSSQVEGIVHLPGKDLLMIVDRGLDKNLIVDFSGNLTNSYSIDGFGSNSAYTVAINQETCEHVIGDLDADKIITLASAGGGSGSTLNSTADTYLRSKKPNENRGDDDDVRTNNESSDKEQGLFHFDTGSILPSTLLQSAVLRLNISSNNLTSSSATVKVFALIEDWVEMEATWNQRSTGVNWTTAGGTLISPEAASLTVTTSDSGWVEWDITPLVQEWVDGISSNNGVLVTNSENSDLRFHTRENGDASLNPQLVVTLP